MRDAIRYRDSTDYDHILFDVALCTELKDKNGTDIYEGDVVLNEQGNLVEVIYSTNNDRARWCGYNAETQREEFFAASMSEVIVSGNSKRD